MKALKILPLVALCLVACSKKEEAQQAMNSLAPNPAAPAPNAPLIGAPDFTGSWTSGCVDSMWGASAGKRIVTMQFSGNNLTRTENTYVDDNCTVANGVPSSYAGTYVLARALDGGFYDLEQTVPSSNGGPAGLRYLKVKLADDAITSSDYYGGPDDDANVRTALTLKKDANAPAPAQPGNSGAVLASGLYQDASGVFCEQVVSTMKQNGVLGQVYIDMQDPCNGQLSLACSGGVCSDDSHRLTVINESSYQFENLSNGKKATMQKSAL